MEKYYYEMECYVCDSITRIVVIDEDEHPNFCPMCASDAEVKFLGDSDGSI